MRAKVDAQRRVDEERKRVSNGDLRKESGALARFG